MRLHRFGRAKALPGAGSVAEAAIGIAMAMLPAACLAQACEKIGAAPIEVCKVVGVRCSPPTNGVCATIIMGRHDSDCLCVIEPPGGLHADLAAVGYLPNADGAAYVDNVAGELLAAIGAEGLAPLASYRALNHSSGDCFDGLGVPIGMVFQANAEGKAGVIGDIQNPGAISVQDQAGIPVLCGTVHPVATVPSAFSRIKVLYRDATR